MYNKNSSIKGKIDVHHHILPKEYLERLKSIGITIAAPGAPFPKWTPEKSLSFMKKTGIDTAILSISAPGVSFKNPTFSAELSRICNEYMAEMKKRYVGKFGGFASIPLPYTKGAINELKYALDELKLEGVCLFTNYDGKYLGDKSFEKFFEELNKRNAIVYIHPAAPAKAYDPKLEFTPFLIEAPFETTRAVTNLIYNGVVDRYKNIRYILSHGGGTIPYIGWRLAWINYGQKDKRIRGMLRGFYDLFVKDGPETGLNILKKGNMYYDTALVSGDSAIKALHAFAGSSRIIIGSDFPFLGAMGGSIVLKNLKKYSGFSKKDFEAIEYNNCLGLFPQFLA